jgi:exopolysaccharide biosynthesis WecB/TagA/CpsF family protein
MRQISTERILGVSFFNGGAAEAVEHLQRFGGYVVAPVSPALIKLNYDQDYRRALEKADLAIADSGFLVILWRVTKRSKLTKISGLAYLKCLIDCEGIAEGTLWIVSSEVAKVKAIDWLREKGLAIKSDNFYVAPQILGSEEYYDLLQEIEAHRPSNIVVAIGGGAQEKLGLYIRDYLLYRPRIHCIGAALGFLTGNERPIPDWADHYYLGWVSRLLSQPRMLIPRLWVAVQLTGMVLRYGSELPPLKARWADL